MQLPVFSTTILKKRQQWSRVQGQAGVTTALSTLSATQPYAFQRSPIQKLQEIVQAYFEKSANSRRGKRGTPFQAVFERRGKRGNLQNKTNQKDGKYKQLIFINEGEGQGETPLKSKKHISIDFTKIGGSLFSMAQKIVGFKSFFKGA